VAVLTCAQKLTSQLNLPRVTKNKKSSKEKNLKVKKTDKLRSIGSSRGIREEEKEGYDWKELRRRKVLSLK